MFWCNDIIHNNDCLLQGILLFGPPGTGKTFIGKAIATRKEVTFILVGNEDLIGTVNDEAENRMKIIFEMVICKFA